MLSISTVIPYAASAMRRLRDGWILAAYTFLLTASFTAFFGWDQMRVDATAYWQAGVNLRTGAALYSATPVAALDKAYLYPPAFAAAFAPLTLLPTLWGYALWMALELLFTLALARVAAEHAGLADGPGAAERDSRRTALALALAAGVVPIHDNIGEGQVNVLVTLLAALAVRDAERRVDWRAGLALAAAAHVKLVPIVLVGAWLGWRRFRLVAWTVVGVLMLALLPLPWRVATMGTGAGVDAFFGDYAGFWGHILWPGASAHQVAGVDQLFAPNYSLRATLARLFVDGTALSAFPAFADRRGPLVFAAAPAAVHAVASLLGLAALAAALGLCVRSAHDRAARITAAGLLLLAAGFASPSFWQHHLVVAAIAAAGFWRLTTPNPVAPRALAWTAAVTPFVATITLPYALALGLTDAPYVASREYGLPTAAVLAFFVTATVATLRRQGRASASSRATVAAIAPRAPSSAGAESR